jgi:hypothetical protein
VCARRPRRIRPPQAFERLEPRRLFTLTVTPFDPADPATLLTDALVVGGSGITVSGASFTGVAGQAGAYRGMHRASESDPLDLDDGVLLTTGAAWDAQGPNDNPGTTSVWGTPGDADADTLVGGATFDAAVLTVQFTADPATRSVSFDLVFASEEFAEYVGSINDAFGAFLDGVQISFDADGKPLAVANDFFLLNNSGAPEAGKTSVSVDVEYDGLTPRLTTTAPLVGTGAHTLKLVIADATDPAIDSAVFLSNLSGSTAVVEVPSTSGAPATFDFAAAGQSVANTAGSATVTVTRGGDVLSAATVDYVTADSTARAGVDYAATSGTLTFEAGETTAAIAVPLLDRADAAESQSFTLALSNPSPGAAIGSAATHTVAVTNDRSPVTFSAATYPATGDDTSATLTVTRGGNTSLSVGVEYATADGTATDGVEYAGVSGLLQFAPGQATQTITVPLTGNVSDPDGVSFTVALSDPSGGAMLGATTVAMVHVANAHSVVQLVAPTASVSNDAGVALVTVRRTANVSVADLVGFHFEAGTAIAGGHFGGIGGAIAFAAGETEKVISVPIFQVSNAPAVVTFDVVLDDIGSAVLGPTRRVTVSITNPHSVVSFASGQFGASEADGAATITLTRTGNIDVAAGVRVVPAGGTATAGSDYPLGSQWVEFAAGQDTATFQIPLNPDREEEPTETLILGMAEFHGGAEPGLLSAVLSIADSTPLIPQVDPNGVAPVDPRPGLVVRFTRVLQAAPPLTAFALFVRGAEAPGGHAKARQLPLSDVTYDSTERTVTVRPKKLLHLNRFYSLVIDGREIRSQDGHALDGAGTGVEGSPLVLTFGRGKKLKYVDHDGDIVKLSLRGRGVMRVLRRPDGEGQALTVYGAMSTTTLSGRVVRSRMGGTGQTTLVAIDSLGTARDALPRDQFTIGG